MPVIAGKWVKLNINDTLVKCQLDLSLNFTNNTSTEDPCKPEDPGLGATNNEYTIDSTDWTIDFSGKQMADELAMAGFDQTDLLDLILNGDSTMDIEISTVRNSTRYPYPVYITYTGTVLLTEASLNWPATGSATYDASFQGNSNLVQAVTAVTPTP